MDGAGGSSEGAAAVEAWDPKVVDDHERASAGAAYDQGDVSVVKCSGAAAGAEDEDEWQSFAGFDAKAEGGKCPGGSR